MIEREIVIANRLGLHARAAAKFVHTAQSFRAKVTVSKDATRVDGKSILGLLTLAASRGTRLRLAAEGDDGEAALDALEGLVRDRFGEDA
ncbi:MAG TPA: HPr family phosphocarrier protein [Candidatus Polarisedimenticolaceae bacterium]